MKEENPPFQNFGRSPLEAAHDAAQQFHQVISQGNCHGRLFKMRKESSSGSVIEPHAGTTKRFILSSREFPLNGGPGVVLKSHAEEMIRFLAAPLPASDGVDA